MNWKIDSWHKIAFDKKRFEFKTVFFANKQARGQLGVDLCCKFIESLLESPKLVEVDKACALMLNSSNVIDSCRYFEADTVEAQINLKADPEILSSF